MSVADQVYEQVKALPDPLARKVLEFVTSVRERAERTDWRDLMAAQSQSLSTIWDSTEDEVWDHA